MKYEIYEVKGLRTSAGNRDFYSLYPPRNATGPAVSRLIEVGANIVGVTKTVQFANGDRATAVSLEFPFDQNIVLTIIGVNRIGSTTMHPSSPAVMDIVSRLVLRRAQARECRRTISSTLESALVCFCARDIFLLQMLISLLPDTGGSIRGPAGANGLYGIRPSVGAISLDDVVPLNVHLVLSPRAAEKLT